MPRRKRRDILDEREETHLVRNAFLDKEFGKKAQQVFDGIKKVTSRQYTPRELTDLFTQHQEESA